MPLCGVGGSLSVGRPSPGCSTSTTTRCGPTGNVLAGTHHPDRDRQFRYLTRIRRWYLTHGLPVISVDTKKKELVGNFKNPGRCWRKTDRDVLDHDFAKDASGRGIAYGIYDVGRNAGYVVIGTSHETAAFAVAAIGAESKNVVMQHYA